MCYQSNTGFIKWVRKYFLIFYVLKRFMCDWYNFFYFLPKFIIDMDFSRVSSSQSCLWKQATTGFLYVDFWKFFLDCFSLCGICHLYFSYLSLFKFWSLPPSAQCDCWTQCQVPISARRAETWETHGFHGLTSFFPQMLQTCCLLPVVQCLKPVISYFV